MTAYLVIYEIKKPERSIHGYERSAADDEAVETSARIIKSGTLAEEVSKDHEGKKIFLTRISDGTRELDITPGPIHEE